eukprot:PhF_6_TR29923/c0_g1_i1/m.43864
MDAQAPPRTVQVNIWKCQTCSTDCNIIRSENRCLCGHRYKEHNNTPTDSKCKTAKCACRRFYYMCAEGSWIIRCRCKHKHIEHDPKPPHGCLKCAASKTPCKGFDS